MRGKKGRCARKMLESCLLNNTTKTLLKKCQKSENLTTLFGNRWLEAAVQIEKCSFLINVCIKVLRNLRGHF